MANSEIILTSTTHPGDASTVVVTGSAFKGDGYYGRSDGIHTVQYDRTSFLGTIKMQGTLATTPTDIDYFDIISNTDGTAANGAVIYNFTGNYVWVRTVVTYTQGSVNSIKLNH